MFAISLVRDDPIFMESCPQLKKKKKFVRARKNKIMTKAQKDFNTFLQFSVL